LIPVPGEQGQAEVRYTAEHPPSGALPPGQALAVGSLRAAQAVGSLRAAQAVGSLRAAHALAARLNRAVARVKATTMIPANSPSASHRWLPGGRQRVAVRSGATSKPAQSG
jgi:hypothetical protein